MLKIYALFSDQVSTSPFKLDCQAAREAVQRNLPGVCHYRQFTRTTKQFAGAQPAAYIASAEFWMAEEQSAKLAKTMQAITHAGDDLSNIFDRDPQLVEYAVEHNIMGRPTMDSGFKCTFLFNRRPSLSLEAFHQHWLTNHGPIAAQTQDAERYVQSHFHADDRSFDGITELFWADHATAEASMASEQMRTDQANDAQKFVDADSLIMFLGAETV